LIRVGISQLCSTWYVIRPSFKGFGFKEIVHERLVPPVSSDAAGFIYPDAADPQTLYVYRCAFLAHGVDPPMNIRRHGAHDCGQSPPPATPVATHGKDLSGPRLAPE
jgi:hypothetical protein